MRRVVPVLLAVLVVGCSPVAPPVTPPVIVQAPASPVFYTSTPAEPLVGMVSRSSERDPFGLPHRPSERLPTAPPPAPVRRVPHPLFPTPSAPAVPDAPVVQPAYTVSGIVCGHQGKVALMSGKDGCLVVQSGTRLPGRLRVEAISEEAVYIIGNGHRFTLPLRLSAPNWQTRHAAPGQDPNPTAENVS